ncbi:cyclic nucleotide-binding domain-containing protein [Haliangium sp.]|uniref:cyclic nucleotide-binding domain-containing protein n=1 Tax=Haliangium sp. TaxID=2663208 RepID=UPI003D12DBCA
MKLRKLIKELKRRLGKDRDNVNMRLELAALYRDSGNAEDAVTTYREVALACRDSGRLDDALHACRLALEVDPNNVEIRALILDLRRARRAVAQAQDGARGRRPRRRARFWPSQGQDEDSLDISSADTSADTAPVNDGEAPALGALPDEPAGSPQGDAAGTEQRLPSQSEIEIDESSSQVSFIPTPLPAPLPLHEAADDSLMAQQPQRFRKVLTGKVPSISLPLDIAGSDDELLDVDTDAPTPPVEAVEPHPDDVIDEVSEVDTGADLLGEDPDEEAQTDVRDAGLGTDARPQVARPSQELTTPVAASYQDPHGSVATAASGEITLARVPVGAARAAGRAVDDDGDEPTLVKDSPSQPMPAVIPPLVVDSAPTVVAGEYVDETVPVHVPLEDEVSGRATQIRAATPVPRPSVVAVSSFEPGDTETGASADRDVTELLAATFDFLPAEVVGELAARSIRRHLSGGVVVFAEGDPGDACFLVLSGEVGVHQRESHQPHGDLVETVRLGRGALFGELALLAARRRRGGVVTAGECLLCEIPRRLLRELAAAHAAVGPLLDAFYRDHLVSLMVDTAPFMRELGGDRQARLRRRFEIARVESDAKILRQGGRTGGLYLVMLGSLEITRQGPDGRHELLATLGEGAYVGDMSLLGGATTTGATVTTAGPVELATLSPDDFLSLVGENRALWNAIRERGNRAVLESCALFTGETSMV